MRNLRLSHGCYGLAGLMFAAGLLGLWYAGRRPTAQLRPIRPDLSRYNPPISPTRKADPEQQRIGQSRRAPGPVAARNTDPCVSILTYHRVAPRPAVFTVLPPEKFAEQMKYLYEHGYRVMPLHQLVRSLRSGDPLPASSVVLTFDDGYESCYTEVYPVLCRYQFPATLFVYTAYLGRGGSALSWSQLAVMVKSGLIDVQGHTASHPNLPEHQPGETEVQYTRRIREELQGSKRLLEERFGRGVNILAYPFGYYNTKVAAQVQASQYEAAVTISEAPVTANGSDLLRLPRQVIYRNDTLADFAAKVRSQPLVLQEHSPREGSVITDQRPEITAVLAEKVRSETVLMCLERTKVEARYDLQSRTIRYRPKKPLPIQVCIVNLSAWTETGSFKQAAWCFEVGKP